MTNSTNTATNTTTIDNSDNCRTAYNQVCTSFHAIDDLRTKLLGFLPLVTGGGLILLTGKAGEVRKEFFGPLGLFGILATFGLLVYELNGVKRCLELIYDGEALERSMHLESGQFITRVAGFCKLFTEPPGPPKFFTRPFAPSKFFTGPFALSNIFTKPFAAGWIYPAALAAWTYLALFLYHRGLANVASPIVLVVGLMGVVRYDYDWSKKLYEQYLCRKAKSKRSEQEVQTPDC